MALQISQIGIVAIEKMQIQIYKFRIMTRKKAIADGGSIVNISWKPPPPKNKIKIKIKEYISVQSGKTWIVDICKWEFFVRILR